MQFCMLLLCKRHGLFACKGNILQESQLFDCAIRKIRAEAAFTLFHSKLIVSVEGKDILQSVALQVYKLTCQLAGTLAWERFFSLLVMNEFRKSVMTKCQVRLSGTVERNEKKEEVPHLLIEI